RSGRLRRGREGAEEREARLRPGDDDRPRAELLGAGARVAVAVEDEPYGGARGRARLEDPGRRQRRGEAPLLVQEGPSGAGLLAVVCIDEERLDLRRQGEREGAGVALRVLEGERPDVALPRLDKLVGLAGIVDAAHAVEAGGGQVELRRLAEAQALD